MTISLYHMTISHDNNLVLNDNMLYMYVINLHRYNSIHVPIIELYFHSEYCESGLMLLLCCLLLSNVSE